MSIKNILFNSLLNNLKDLKNRIIYLFFYIFILRIGNFILIPGINIYILNNIFRNISNINFINIFNIISGINILNFSIFSLGIIPYISSSIIIQLLTIIFPYFIKLKNNIYGKYLINKYIKYLTLFLSIIQSIIIFIIINKFNNYNNSIFLYDNFIIYVTSIVSLITGTMFLLWLNEQISKNSLGNGISIIMLVNIISNLYNFLYNLLNIINIISYIKLFLVFLIVIFIIYLIFFIEMAERRILIIYPSKRFINIKYFFSSYNNFLPLKINMAGIMPSVFASSIMLIPYIILLFLNNFIKFNFLFYLYNLFYPKNFLYLLIYIFFIIFFYFFYTLLLYNSNNISKNLSKNNAYIPGVRPGKDTSIFLRNIILRLTLFGSLYILIICLISDFIYNILNININFNFISLLIVIIVFMEIIFQIKSLIISNNYFSIIKKYN